MLLTVHDELVFEVEESIVSKVRDKIVEIMEGVISPQETNGVPLLVSSSVGKNWGEMKK
jgi:DNA polymerase-1